MSKERIQLLINDIAGLTVAFLVAFYLRLVMKIFEPIDYSPYPYTLSFLASLVLLITIFNAFKLYEIRQIELSARIITVIKALSIWFLIVATLIFSLKFDFSRAIFFMTAIMALILITTGRYLLFRHRLRNKNSRPTEVTIIGNGNRAHELEKQIGHFYQQATFFSLSPRHNNTLSFLSNRPASDIFLADEHLSANESMVILANERLSHHHFRVVTDAFRLVTGRIEMSNIDEIPSLNSRQKPVILYMILKRIFDIICSFITLILVSPLWLVIVLAIKLTDRGPALIKQTRIGWNGRPFTILKFRTMHNHVSLYEPAPKVESDERITSIGRILRRLSLDELPQLWNILKGEMSLVGPRPEMEFIVRSYAPWQNVRLLVKPGLTGLWQILGRKDLPLHENLEYDFYYVCNRGFLLDATIILKTIPSVLFGKGAY